MPTHIFTTADVLENDKGEILLVKTHHGELCISEEILPFITI